MAQKDLTDFCRLNLVCCCEVFVAAQFAPAPYLVHRIFDDRENEKAYVLSPRGG